MILTDADIATLRKVLAAAENGDERALAWVRAHWDTVVRGVTAAISSIDAAEAEPPHDDPPARRRIIEPPP